MDRQDRETRRAENQVWNGWGDYARKPELLTFDRAGDAELYGNTVLGLACRYYDFDRFRPLLNEFHRSAQEALYTDMFFLVLEGAVFARGAAERPLLPALRPGPAACWNSRRTRPCRRCWTSWPRRGTARRRS